MFRIRFVAFAMTMAIGLSGQLPSAQAADCGPQIRKLIAGHLGIPPAKVENRNTFKQLGADDLDLVEIVMALEEEFDIQIPDDAVENFTSVDATVAYVNKRSKKCR
jgi:acyl carrier protein